MLGNEVGQLNLSKEQMFNYCLVVERHPDNVGAALFGGFIGAFTKLTTSDAELIERTPLREVLPALPGGTDPGLLTVHKPPRAIGSPRQLGFNADIKIIVVIPDFHLNTAEARECLPHSYTRKDLVFNAQRCAVLPLLLAETSLNAAEISEAMQDRLHQPYRAALIPGLNRVLQNIKYDSYPGLLGVCLSGAGPSILALATHNLEMIAQAIIAILSEAQDINYDWQVLELDRDGATCRDLG